MGAADFGASEDPPSQRVMHATALSNKLRPYKCDLCDFKTGQASNLFHHKRKGHRASRNSEKRRTRKRKQEKDSDIKCSTDIPKSDAKTKTRRKRGKDAELKCLECSFNIKSTIKLVYHYRDDHKKDIAPDTLKKLEDVNSQNNITRGKHIIYDFMVPLHQQQ